MFSLISFIVYIVFAQSFQPTKSSLSLIIGWTQPIFGDFGDVEKGFKGNFSYGIMYMKDYDDLISYGFNLGNTSFLKNRPTGLKINFFSAVPLIAIKSDYKKKSIVYFGMGVYHWSSPSQNSYISTSDDDFGFKFGYLKTIYSKMIDLSIGIEWNYIIGVRGMNFDLGNINMINPYISIRYDFK